MLSLRARLAVGFALLSVFGAGAAAAAAASPNVVISEFRFRGPSGGNDEFVELYNASTAPVPIGGWQLKGSNNAGTTSVRATIQANRVLAAGCHYLLTNSAASGYSGSVGGDLTYSTGVTDDGGIALVAADGATIVDAVGLSPGSAFGEGARLASLGSTSANRSYERKPGGPAGSSQDTDSNAADFQLISPSDPQNSQSTCVTSVVRTDPSGIGAAAPSTVAAGGTTLLTVQVTGGENPDSTGLAVSANLSPIGGPLVQQLFDDGTHGDATANDGTFSYLATVAENAAVGSKTINATITDAEHRSGSATISLSVTSACGAAYTRIPAIQGSGAATTMAGQHVNTEGVVVGDYEGPAPGLRGFFVQDAQGDGDVTTSDGIFVFEGDADTVSVGDRVRVFGTVTEFQDETEISASAVAVCATSQSVRPTDVDLPVPPAVNGVDYLERFEGMLVRFPQTLYVTEHFQLGRFGQVLMSSGSRLQVPTSVVAPGAAAQAMEAANRRNQILFDDADNGQNADPIVFGRENAYLSAVNTLRGGDTATNTVGVLTYTWAGNSASGNAFRLRPVNALGGSVRFEPANPRPTAAPSLGGDVKVGGMNLLNYFNTFTGCTAGVSGGAIDCRGADNQAEFDRQWPKTVAAITKLNPDVLGVMELENDGYGPTSALQQLVDKLNAATSPGKFAFIDVDANTGQVDALGSDAIRVALLYQPARVTPVGDTAVLNSVAFVNGGDSGPRNRPSLAQAFRLPDGEQFVIDVNHLKSKGSACDAPDTGDGQANCAIVRTNAAKLLAQWLATDPTGVRDPDVILVGDLNSYAKEDPIAALEAGGFTNLIAKKIGAGAYSYVFDGEWGYLDYALGTDTLTDQVSGVAEWHVNADEPSVLDYNVDFKSAGQRSSLYAPDEYRISDHDPVVVGLDLRTTAASLCSLTQDYVTKNAGLANSLCVKLRNGAIGAYRNEVAAQTGKAIAALQAEILANLSRQLG